MKTKRERKKRLVQKFQLGHPLFDFELKEEKRWPKDLYYSREGDWYELKLDAKSLHVVLNDSFVKISIEEMKQLVKLAEALKVTE